MALVKGTEPWAQLTASGGTRIGGNVACLSLNGILPLRPPPPHGSVDGATWETRVQGVPARPLMSQHFPVQAHAWQPVAARISLPLAMVPERRDGSRGGGEEPCRAGAALVCGEQHLPVRGPMGCCPKRKGKTAARGLGAQQLHRREQLRQAPVSAAGSCVPEGAASCCDRCWFPVALAHPTGPPQAPCAEQGWAGSEEQPWGAARREAGICAQGGGGCPLRP